MMRVELPWPPKYLRRGGISPGREGWAKAYRDFAALLTQKAGVHALYRPGVVVTVDLRPPSNWKLTKPEAIARVRSGLEGVADAIGVEVDEWQLTAALGDRHSAGAVIVEIEGTAL
jgi:crossover junction endodeoxyribonuclease RusA